MDMPGCEAWNRYVRRLESHVENPLRESVDDYGKLFVTFEMSIKFLDEKPREETLHFPTKLSFAEMHRRLCILQKQDLAPFTMLMHVWGVESGIHAEKIARTFVEVGLASGEAVQVGSNRTWQLSLHHSLHEFAVLEARHHQEEKYAHESFLSDYGRCDPDVSCGSSVYTKWWSSWVHDDGYIHRNLCRHLVAADRGKELVELFKTPQWTARQLEVNDALVLNDDFSIAIKVTRDEMIDGMGKGRSDAEETLRLISDAVTLSSSFIARNPREIWFQIYGRLTEHAKEIKGIQEYLSRVAKEARRNWLRCLNGILEEAGAVNTRVIDMGHPVMSMAKIGDGERFVFAYGHSRIGLMDAKRGEIENEWEVHKYFKPQIAIGRGGKRVVSTSRDTTVTVWDVETHRCVTTFEGHRRDVKCVAVMEDEGRVVTGSSDGTTQVWDIDRGRVVSEPFRGHKGGVLCVSVLGDGEHVVTGGRDNMLRLWSTTTGVQVGEEFIGHMRWVETVSVTPDGKRIVSGSSDQTLRIWDVASHKQIGESLMTHTKPVNCVAVSKDGKRIAYSTGVNTIRVLDMETRKNICDPLEGHTYKITGVSFVDSSDSIISCSSDGTVRMWDVRRKKAERIWDRHDKDVMSVSFTPDGKLAVSGSVDKTVRIWDVISGRQIGDPLEGHCSSVTGVAVTPDGKRIVSVSPDRTIRVWDLRLREILHLRRDHVSIGSIRSVAISPKGQFIVTGSDDGSICSWDLTVMERNEVVVGWHDESIERVFVSDDGKRVIAIMFVHWHQEILVCELETEKIVKRITSTNANAQFLSRQQVMDLVGETTVHDDAGLSIPLHQRQILYGDGENKEVLGTLNANVRAWALSPDRETICVGLENGKVGFMKLEK